MNTLTVPKIKDLVNKPKEQYKDLFQTMQQQQGISASNNISISNGTERVQGNQKIQDTSNKDMTDELSSFLNDLKKKGGENYSVPDNNTVVEHFNIGSAFSTF